jgi:hypothetical protein
LAWVGSGTYPQPMARDSKPSAPPVGRTMRAAHARHHEHGQGEGTAKAGELIEAAFVGGASPSAAARKVFALMLVKAAGTAWEDRWHVATKAELQQAHQTKARMQDVLDELATTLLRVRVTGDDGPEVLTGAIIDGHKITDADDATARVRWKFSDAMREVMRRSDYYAELRAQVIGALDSRYSVTLYELGCGHYRRRRPVWSGTVAEFRAVLGVPDTYRDWTDVRRRALDAAKEEVNFLAPFTLTWHEHRQGRAVVRVDLRFHPKDDVARADAEAELRKSRVGRKARRAGTVEQVAAIAPGVAADLDKLR